MKTILQLLAYAVLVVAILASLSCDVFGAGKNKGPNRTKDGRIEVEFWHAMGSQIQPHLNAIIDDYNASQSTYFVVAIHQGNYNSLSQKLIASLYAGENPAAAQMYESWSARFMRFGYLKSIESVREWDAAGVDELTRDMFPAFLDNCRDIDPETKQSVIATLPFNKSVYLLFVNYDMMREAGRTGPPGTWAEWKKLCEDLTKRSGGTTERYGFATRDNIEAFTVKLFADGTNYMDAEGNLSFSGTSGQEAMAFLTDLVVGEGKSGYVESDYLNSVFGDRRIAMFIGSTAGTNYVDSSVGSKFVWRAYPMPGKEKAEDARMLSQGTNMGIFNNVSEEEQRGAWDFFKYLSSPEVNARWAQRTGYLPTRRATLEVPAFAEFIANDENYAAAMSCLDRLQFEPKPMWWDSARKVIDQAVQTVLTGSKSPKDALQEAERSIRTIIASEEGV